MQRIIPVWEAKDIKLIKEVCLLGRQALDAGHRMVHKGVTTDEIDKKVHQVHMDSDAYPSPLNYHKFPKSCCTYVIFTQDR